MPPRYRVDELVRLQARTEEDLDEDTLEGAHDAYGDAFGWVDHRSMEQEVVSTFAWQLLAGDTLDFREDDERQIDIPIYQGVEYPVPLTRTGSDRYVMANSLAEILKERYAVFVQIESWQGDTHAFLVLPNEDAAELERRHPSWMRENLQRLPDGIDHFSGLKIPWLGHEDAASDFARGHAKSQERLAADRAKIEAKFKNLFPPGQQVESKAEDFSVVRTKQQLASFAFFAAAAAWTVARLMGYGPPASWSWVPLFATAGWFHLRVAWKMRDGYLPPVWLRLLPLGVLLLMAFTGVGQSAPPP